VKEISSSYQTTVAHISTGTTTAGRDGGKGTPKGSRPILGFIGDAEGGDEVHDTSSHHLRKWLHERWIRIWERIVEAVGYGG